MTEDQDSQDTGSDPNSKTFVNKAKERKTRNRPLTKIVLRRLPPSMTEESFLEQVSPIPDHDYFYFAKPDPSLGNCCFSRAYMNFINVEDIYLFKDKFDGYVFLDEKGVEYGGIVEYAPFQRIPKKKKKKDPKCGTIESDPIFQEFIESLKEQDTENREPKLEYSYQVHDGNDKKVISTPLLDYLAARKQDKRSRDERRRRENDKRKMRIERKTKDGSIKEEDVPDPEVKKVKSRDWEKDKQSFKKKDEEVKAVENKDSTSNVETKSYREQRKVGLLNILEKRKRADDDKKENSKDFEQDSDDNQKGARKEKKEKFKDIPREQKSKKYSDTRKERIKLSEKKIETNKFEKTSLIARAIVETKSTEKAPEVRKSLSHNDIKPFTQLPQVKTDDLTKVIEEMDRKMKLEEQAIADAKFIKGLKHLDNGKTETKKKESDFQQYADDDDDASGKPILCNRRNSLESSGLHARDDFQLKRQKSLDDSSKSSDREDSVEKDRADSASERRSDRRIRNKDRPSLVIYQPGMGKFSKQRIPKDKDSPQTTSPKPVNDLEKQDT